MIRLLAVPILFQALLIVHVVKTGRDRMWIYLLVFLPYAGGLAYLFVEVIPSFFNRRNVDRVGDAVGGFLNPGGRLKRLEDQAGFSPTFRNICAVGDAYLDLERFSEAAVMYEKALVPPFESNDEYLYKLAYSRFKAGDNQEARKVMARLSEVGLGKLKARETLLLGYITENLKQTEEARELYLEATRKSSDLSYQLDFARFLVRNGEKEAAVREYGIIIGTYDRLPRNFRKQYRTLIDTVRQEYRQISA